MKYKNTSAWWKIPVCVAAGMLAVQLAHAQYSTDFESPTFSSGLIAGQDSWTSTASRTNARVLTATEITDQLVSGGVTDAGTVVHGGEQAFLLSGADSSSTSTRAISGIPRYSKVTAELWARPLGARTNGPNLGNVFVTLNSATGTRTAAFRFGYDSATTTTHIDYANSSSGIWFNSGLPWDSNTWYRIKFEVDYATETYDFFVDGNKANTDPIPFYQGNRADNFGQILFFRGSAQAGMIADDIAVTGVAPTSPVVKLDMSNPFGFRYAIYDVGMLTPNTNSISVSLDGSPVALTSVSQSGNVGGGDDTGVTLAGYNSTTQIMTPGTTHTNVITFSGDGFAEISVTNVFTVASVQGSLDRAHHYFGKFQGTTLPVYSADGDGRTGVQGDFAVDMGNPPSGNGKIVATDSDLLNSLRGAIQNDVLTLSIWTKRRAIGSSSVFWLNSPTAPNGGRAFQLHCPYWDGNLYFDTGGSGSDSSRLTTNISGLGGDTFWTNAWHHIVAVKNGGAKQVWVDGQLVAEQTSGAASIAGYNDVLSLVIGAAWSDNLPVNGLIDDFAAYSTALSESDIVALHNGTAPDSVSAGSSLLAWWDFNDAPWVKVEHANGKTVVNFQQTLQYTTNLSVPFSDVSGATSPFTNSISGDAVFFRTRK